VSDENAVLQYWKAINTGEINVGKWIRLLYEVVLEGITDNRWFFDTRKGNNAIAFIERFCHHFKGKLAPGRIKLELWQRASVFLIFGVVDGAGRRQFREVAWYIGRKMGKSLIAAGIMEYIAFAAGEFGSEIYFLATKVDQADLSYSAFEFNFRHEPILGKRIKSTKRGLMIDETNTLIKRLPFSDKTLDGLNPMAFLGDEASSWSAKKGLSVWEVMMSGTGAREEPLGMAISSGGYISEGIYDELFARGTAFLKGNSREQHILPIFYMIDDEEKWNDIEELKKSLPGLGVSVSEEFIRSEIDIAEGSLSKKIEFLTKYANLKQNPTVSWLTAAEVNGCFGDNAYTLEDFRHCYALTGVDLSITTDLTATVALIERGGVVYFFAQFYMPRNVVDVAAERDQIPYRKYIEQGYLTESGENQVDYHDCEKWYERLESEYEIIPLKNGYDTYTAAYLVQDLENAGHDMEAVKQGPNLTGVIIDVEGMIRDKRLQSANQNGLMKIHMIDSAIKMDTLSKRRQLVKIKDDATVHIDGMAALLDAMCMRRNYYNELEHLLRNEREETGEKDGGNNGTG